MHSTASMGRLSLLPSLIVFLVGLAIYRKPIFDPVVTDPMGRIDFLRQARR